MSFGVSLGDFLYVGALALKVADALSRTRGATTEFRSTADFLRSMDKALSDITSQMSEVFSQNPDVTEKMEEEGLVRALEFNIVGCRRLLEEFEERFRRYHAMSDGGGGGGSDAVRLGSWLGKTSKSAKQMSLRISWVIRASGEARELRSRLVDHLNTMNYLIGSSNALTVRKVVKTQAEIKAVVNSVDERTAEILETVRMIRDEFMYTGAARSMGFSLEGTGGDCFYVVDWFGKTHQIPLALYNTTGHLDQLAWLMFQRHCWYCNRRMRTGLGPKCIYNHFNQLQKCITTGRKYWIQTQGGFYLTKEELNPDTPLVPERCYYMRHSFISTTSVEDGVESLDIVSFNPFREALLVAESPQRKMLESYFAGQTTSMGNAETSSDNGFSKDKIYFGPEPDTTEASPSLNVGGLISLSGLTAADYAHILDVLIKAWLKSFNPPHTDPSITMTYKELLRERHRDHFLFSSRSIWWFEKTNAHQIPHSEEEIRKDLRRTSYDLRTNSPRIWLKLNNFETKRLRLPVRYSNRQPMIRDRSIGFWTP